MERDDAVMPRKPGGRGQRRVKQLAALLELSCGERQPAGRDSVVGTPINETICHAPDSRVVSLCQTLVAAALPNSIGAEQNKATG
jgi:hypothetical protein